MRRSASAVTLALVLAAPPAATGTENGGTSRPPGVDTVRVGFMPPPGSLFMLSTAAHYTADRFLDGSGNDRPGISNVDFSFSAVSTRLGYVWPGVNLLGADVETRGGIVLYAHGKSDFDLQLPTGRVHRSFSAEGLGDMFLAPVLLGWHQGDFHHIAGLLVFVPTGDFDRANPVSVGRNYWGAAPSWYFTWLPGPPWEVSGSAFYTVNGTNDDTNYKSGREAAFDWGIGYSPSPGWQLGASGYFYRQVTNDVQNGQVFGDGNRGKAIAVGPFLRFFGKGWGLTFKWQHETEVANRAKGERFFLQAMIQLM
jgi:hypothetical protein